MREYRTTSCKLSGHREIVISLEATAAIDPNWLVAYFEHAVRSGRRFKPNETVQIGWMIITLRLTPNDELEVWEPQFDSLPIDWIKGGNNTMRHLILQKSVCEQFHCEPDFPSLRQAGTVARRFLDATSGFTMSRDQSSNNDSGWVFSVSDEQAADDEGEFRSLFEIAFYHNEVIAFLAMPTGAIVVKEGNHIEATIHNTRLSSKDNNLIQRLSQSPLLI